MADFDTMSYAEKLAYVVRTARQLSEITLKLGEAEAAALLSVIAGNLSEDSDVA